MCDRRLRKESLGLQVSDLWNNGEATDEDEDGVEEVEGGPAPKRHRPNTNTPNTNTPTQTHLQHHLFTTSQSCSAATRQSCVNVLEKVPIERFLTLGHGYRALAHRQLLYGKRDTRDKRDDTRPTEDDTIPESIVRLFVEARAALLASSEELTEDDIPSVPVAATVNRYPVSDSNRGRGSQLGLHQDKGKWRPLVMGVTLGPDDWRVMKFVHKPTTTSHKIRTTPGDAYLFREAMYTDWHHASMTRSGGQSGTIYSVTFRWKGE